MGNWTIKINEEHQIIETICDGILTGEEFLAASESRNELSKKTGITKLLLDAEKIILDNSATLGIYELAQKKYTDWSKTQKIKIAVVMPKHKPSQEMARFYETVCLNRGHEVKVIHSRKDGIKWLNSFSEKYT